MRRPSRFACRSFFLMWFLLSISLCLMNSTLNLTFLPMSLKVIRSCHGCFTQASEFSVHLFKHFFFSIWILHRNTEQTGAFLMCISGIFVGEFSSADTAGKCHDDTAFWWKCSMCMRSAPWKFLKFCLGWFQYGPIVDHFHRLKCWSAQFFVCRIYFKCSVYLQIKLKSFIIQNLSSLYLVL